MAQLSDWPLNTVAYENFYEAGRLANPRVVKSEKLLLFNPCIVEPFFANHYPSHSTDNISLINRTIMAYGFLQIPDAAGIEPHLLALLGLDKTHLQYAEEVMNLSRGVVIGVDGFCILKDYFGFTLEDYSSLPYSYSVRASFIGQLYRVIKDDTSISRHHWSQVCRKTFDELKAIADEGCHGVDSDTLLGLMASIPDEFIEEYWEVISAGLMMGENQVNYFALRTVVQHFHSHHTITRFLKFLNRYPDAAEAVKPEDPRWFDYLVRARDLAAQHSDLPLLFKSLFHDQPLNNEMSMSLPEVEQRFAAAAQLGWEVSDSLLEVVCKKRGWL
jgi:hypothetical protein